MDDLGLITYSLRGDDAAFRRLLERHLSSVHAFVFQIVRDRVMADDIVQETFIKVWTHLARFDKTRSFKTWLFIIAKRTAFDFCKKNNRTVPFSSFADEEGKTGFEEMDDESMLPDELLERKDIAVSVDRALGSLPESSRSILILAYKEDFSLREIADILGESYNTVKSRHNRAIKRLKEAVLKDAPETRGKS